MGILVITTGGTIGALAYDNLQYPPDISIMPEQGTDLVKDALRAVDFSFAEKRCISLEARDSKLIDNTYRDKILSLIDEAPEDKIIITHGTDRILESADYFYHKVLLEADLCRNKNIILTGAMIPLANGPESDGYLNLIFAMQQLECLKKPFSENCCAVYIVLCNYDDPETGGGLWKPRLYLYVPHQYVKYYANDGRYNRLKRVNKNDKN